MDVISMMNEIPSIANSMICKPALPDFGVAADERSELVRIGAFD